MTRSLCPAGSSLALQLVTALLLSSASSSFGQRAYLPSRIGNEMEATTFMQHYEIFAERLHSRVMTAHWDYATDVTNVTLEMWTDASSLQGEFERDIWKTASNFSWKDLKNEELKEKFRGLSSDIGFYALEKDDVAKIQDLIGEISYLRGYSQFCSFGNPSKCHLKLEPDLSEVFVHSRNPEELLFYWQQLHDKVGTKMSSLLQQFVPLANKAAELTGFSDFGALTSHHFDSDTLEEDLARVWQTIEPLYLQLHAFVRRKLVDLYGSDVVDPSGPIPAHLLGLFSATPWTGHFSITKPYPERQTRNITAAMIKWKFSVDTMFKHAQFFFSSLGFDKLQSSFWTKSMLVKSLRKRQVLCEEPYTFWIDKDDYRIKMCTEVTFKDFLTVHREMALIQYFMESANQSYLFRSEIIPGFGSTIGDTIGLSVSAMEHLQMMNLISPNVNIREEDDIQHLFLLALDKVAPLPFAYLAELWKRQVFSGNITSGDYRSRWWELRYKIQGISPPNRGNKNYFDPSELYLISKEISSSYARHFVGGVMQFQFHKGLCEEEEKYIPGDLTKPLHKCDIYNSRKSGNLLRKAMQLGSSKSLPEVLKILTRGKSDKLDAAPLLEFFQPLLDFLVKENKATGQTIGWKLKQALSPTTLGEPSGGPTSTEQLCILLSTASLVLTIVIL